MKHVLSGIKWLRRLKPVSEIKIYQKGNKRYLSETAAGLYKESLLKVEDIFLGYFPAKTVIK